LCVGFQFTVYVREVIRSARLYKVETHEHVNFWPIQTGKHRYMAASIADLPGETKPFDFTKSHCTMLQMDNEVSDHC